MFMIDKSSLHRAAISVFAALMVSAACVTAAVAPVKAASISAPRY